MVRARDDLANKPRIFLKVAPNIDEEDIGQIARTAAASDIDGIIATNTTLEQRGLALPRADAAGGLPDGLGGGLNGPS